MSIKLLIKQRGDVPGTQPFEEKTFEGYIVTIGSDLASTLHLNDAGIAPEQAVLISESNQWLLINKADGTALNDEPLSREARRPLADGDSLRVGRHVIRFVFDEPLTDDARHNAPTQETVPPATPPTTHTAAPSGASPQRSFAKILESLRTVEDSFYFMVEGGAQSGLRVPIENTVTMVGWDHTGERISFETAAIVNACAVVRKEWSGIFAQPLGANTITINDEAVATERRLRDNDRLRLLARGAASAGDKPFLIFHEPATLAVLDSLYQPKPEPPATPTAAQTNPAPVAGSTTGQPRARVKFFSADRRYFGYFTLLELLMMCVGTLVAAVIFFLVLVYLKSVR